MKRVFESAGGRLVPEPGGRIGGGDRREAASGDGQWRNRHCGDRGLPAGSDGFFEIRIERPQQDSNLRTRLRRALLCRPLTWAYMPPHGLFGHLSGTAGGGTCSQVREKEMLASRAIAFVPNWAPRRSLPGPRSSHAMQLLVT